MKAVNMNMSKVLTADTYGAVIGGELVTNMMIAVVFVADETEAASVKDQCTVGTFFATWDMSTIWHLKPDMTLTEVS